MLATKTARPIVELGSIKQSKRKTNQLPEEKPQNPYQLAELEETNEPRNLNRVNTMRLENKGVSLAYLNQETQLSRPRSYTYSLKLKAR